MKARYGCSVAVFVFALSTLVHAGGSARFESVLKEMLGTLDKLTTTLAGIRDQEGAKSAQPELRKAAESWQALLKKAENLAPPSADEKERLEKLYAKKLEESRKKLFGEVERVREVAGGREALKEIQRVLNYKGKP